ncbi:hypothetical protein NDU88_002508 [Pleurodeles waltl]|uniref:Uncharacterized protein n=1 Tax=Pleurodeles waltl TaxID=8319 RepID=A0AAV7VF36_PLEWA|nr:hypothetical protein NDU88_002508 [Pleurodeles waltl]
MRLNVRPKGLCVSVRALEESMHDYECSLGVYACFYVRPKRSVPVLGESVHDYECSLGVYACLFVLPKRLYVSERAAGGSMHDYECSLGIATPPPHAPQLLHFNGMASGVAALHALLYTAERDSGSALHFKACSPVLCTTEQDVVACSPGLYTTERDPGAEIHFKLCSPGLKTTEQDLGGACATGFVSDALTADSRGSRPMLLTHTSHKPPFGAFITSSHLLPTGCTAADLKHI